MEIPPSLNKVFPVMLIFLSLWLPPPGWADVLEIPGTGACEVLLRRVAEVFKAQHPGQQVIVPASTGSIGAIRAVSSGQAVLGRVSRPLSQEEKDQGLKYLPFARDMVVFAVGGKVPVRSITTAQLVEIYSGKVTTWKALGGPAVPIRLLIREPGDSSLRIIRRHLPAFRNISFPPFAKMVYSDPLLLTLLQKYHNSIGWLTFSALKSDKFPIHPLVLDGIAPTPENARTQRYSLLEEYALVFKNIRSNDVSERFIDFLFSENGQRILENLGAIPLKKE